MKFIQNTILIASVLIVSVGAVVAQTQATQFAVIPNLESGNYLVTYQGETAADFVLKIRDEQGRVLYQEDHQGEDQLVRSYRIEEATPGELSFELSSEGNMVSKSVAYPMVGEAIQLQLLKDPATERYQVLIEGDPTKEVAVSIYDVRGNLLHRESGTIAQQGQKIFDLNLVPEKAVIFTVSDDYTSAEELVGLRD